MAKERTEHIPEKRRSALVIAPARGGNEEIVRTLQRERFRVTAVRTVYEGIADFSREPSKLVILSMEGLHRRDRKALQIFQRRAPEVRVLLLVPEGRRSQVPSFLEAGADAIAPAPIYGRELALLVRSMLRGDAADPLTGLPNKEAYERAFLREVSRAKREEKTLALAILDLDRFGALNERHGYLTADQVLVDTADRLKDSIRVTDLVTRWGGDEFVALLTRLPADLPEARKEARVVLERARMSMEVPFSIDRKEIEVHLSAGFALFPHEGESREELFAIANHRLQLAKRRRPPTKDYGNRVVGEDEPEGPEPPEAPPPPKPKGKR